MVGKPEITKDTVQVLVESAATHVGRIATIVTGAVREIAHEVGDWATDAFEMRDAAGQAERFATPSDLLLCDLKGCGAAMTAPRSMSTQDIHRQVKFGPPRREIGNGGVCADPKSAARARPSR